MKKWILILILFFNNTQALANQNLLANLLVKTANQQIFDLQKQRGKVVIIFFWASWCVVCQKELIDLNNLYKKYQNQNLEVIGLNVDGRVDVAKNLSYQIAIADEAKINDFDNPRTLPTIYIVDKNGKIYQKIYKQEDIEIVNLTKIVTQLIK
jgi:thiol-disulfide isomerase/thioredoxin